MKSGHDFSRTELGAECEHPTAATVMIDISSIARRKELVATLAAAIGCEPWDVTEAVHNCVGVRRDAARHLLRDQHHHFAIETPDAEDGGTITHVIALMHHAVVRCMVCLPPYIDNVEYDAQVVVRIEDHHGKPSEQIRDAYDKAIQLTAESAAIRHLTWLRELEAGQLAASMRAVFDAKTLASLSRLLAPVRAVTQ